MKNSQAIIVVLVIALLAVSVLAFWKNNHTDMNTIPNTNTNTNTTPVVQIPDIRGCYATEPSRVDYRIAINSQSGSNVSGTLSFRNFEKDSSKGTFVGTFQNGILLVDYTFQSEGMTSVMQVIFKKSGNDFVRGYGPMNADGTKFADLSKVTYDAKDSLSVFKKAECTPVEVTKSITVSGKYVCLPHKDTTGPQTMECAFGIKTDKNLYYAMDFSSMPNFMPNMKTGESISISGLFTPVAALSSNQWQKYPIEGIISVSSFKKL